MGLILRFGLGMGLRLGFGLGMGLRMEFWLGMGLRLGFELIMGLRFGLGMGWGLDLDWEWVCDWDLDWNWDSKFNYRITEQEQIKENSFFSSSVWDVLQGLLSGTVPDIQISGSSYIKGVSCPTVGCGAPEWTHTNVKHNEHVCCVIGNCFINLAWKDVKT